MSIQSTTQKIKITDKGLDATTIKKLPGPPEFTQELNMRQETEGVLLECFLIYEPEHQATWFKEGKALLGGLDYDERYQPFLERRGDWTYCALAIRHLCNDDAGNYSVQVTNKYGEKTNHVRLSMKDPNEPQKIKGGIEPAFFRKPSSRQEGNKLHLECEIEALPPPEIRWFRDDTQIGESERYHFARHVTHQNPNIHFVRLTILDPSPADGGNYIVRATNAMGEKDCTLALNFGGASDNEENVPAKVYEQPELKQPDPSVLILEAHIHANPPPKVTWLRNGDFIKESDRVSARIEKRPGEINRWNATLTIKNPCKVDSGDYKCSIKNKWGNDFTTFALG